MQGHPKCSVQILHAHGLHHSSIVPSLGLRLPATLPIAPAAHGPPAWQSLCCRAPAAPPTAVPLCLSASKASGISNARFTIHVSLCQVEKNPNGCTQQEELHPFVLLRWLSCPSHAEHTSGRLKNHKGNNSKHRSSLWRSCLPGLPPVWELLARP